MASAIVVQTEPTVNSNTGEFTAPDIKNDTLSCNICQEDISDNNIKTPCNHAFCGDCFFKWMQEKPNCPMCRKEFVNEDIMKNISDNREELSILTSELEYTRYQAVRIKRRLCKRKRTCTELLKRQISLKQMLEDSDKASSIQERIAGIEQEKEKFAKNYFGKNKQIGQLAIANLNVEQDKLKTLDIIFGSEYGW